MTRSQATTFGTCVVLGIRLLALLAWVTLLPGRL